MLQLQETHQLIDIGNIKVLIERHSNKVSNKFLNQDKSNKFLQNFLESKKKIMLMSLYSCHNVYFLLVRNTLFVFANYSIQQKMACLCIWIYWLQLIVNKQVCLEQQKIEQPHFLQKQKRKKIV